MSVPDTDTNAEALPDQDADTAALSDVHARDDADISKHTDIDPNWHAGLIPNDEPHTSTFGDSHGRFTVTYGYNGFIARVTHQHADGSDHDCLPDFGATDRTYECIDCGDRFRSVTHRRPADQP